MPFIHYAQKRENNFLGVDQSCTLQSEHSNTGVQRVVMRTSLIVLYNQYKEAYIPNDHKKQKQQLSTLHVLSGRWGGVGWVKNGGLTEVNCIDHSLTPLSVTAWDRLKPGVLIGLLQ